ncbi:MAG: VWA domain-containing protein [Pirellulaceae bacterium]
MALFALSLDLGYICSVRADLQSAVDAGALAGTGVILDGKSKASATAKRFADLNLENSGVPDEQAVAVEVGHWDIQSRIFAPNAQPMDAVKVTARVDKASLFFGRVIGTSNFTTEASAVATYRPRDIMLVLDVSGSMNASRRGVRKIDELRSSVRFFLEYLRQANARDRVGFAYYSTKAALGCGLSDDLDAVEAELMDKLKPDGWTNIADGMKIGLQELKSNCREQVLPLMVVMTDGAANMNQPGNWQNPGEAKGRVIQQAQEAKRQKVPIFTMALDSRDDEVDVALMQRVAEITDSESYHILAGERNNGSSELEEAFRRVAANRPLRIVD